MSQQVILVPFSGQLIGQGYNSETGENVGTALEVDSVFEDSSADAQSSSTLFESVETQDSLKETLGISASADVRVGLFSGGAKMSFTEQHAVNSSSSYVAGRSFVQNAIRYGKGFRLTPEAQAVLSTGNMDEFKKAFGDRFVRSLSTGGEFCIVARITSVSEEHQSKLSASLQGEYSGILTSGHFQAAFDTATAATSGKTEVSVKMLQSGGQGAELSFTGPRATDIIERLKQLPQFVHEHASGYAAELATYDTIPIPVPTVEEREDRTLVLNDCAVQKTGFLRAISDLQLALDDNGSLLFDNLPPKDDLIRMLGQYRATLNGLMAQAIKVSTGRMDPPQMFAANPPPPALAFTKKRFVQPIPIPDNVQIPNFPLLGTDVISAVQSLISLGLQPSVGRRQAPDKVGTVLEQTPNAGPVPKGTMVTLIAGMNGPDMPDAIAMQLMSLGI